MLDKIRKFGAGEILFILIFLLGIFGTVSIFFFDDFFGEHRTTFIIWSSLAFIGGFFVLSVYARTIKRKQGYQYQFKQALGNWMAVYGSGGRPDHRAVLPKGTIDKIALYVFRLDGFRPAAAPRGGVRDILRVVNAEGQLELIQCWQETTPLGLREIVHFYEALRAEQAVRGEIWAVGGFSKEAADWAARKPIVLVNGKQINEIARSLFASQGSGKA
jgi:hypothetical protein